MKQDRKVIWDYLKSIGVELTIAQHNEFRALLTLHDENQEKLRSQELQALRVELAKSKGRSNFFWKKLKQNNLI